ncbi:MAG: hypothetical protein ACJAR3_002885, partial [Roseivirga sp.]
FDQALKLREWLPQTSFVNLFSDNSIHKDCIQYSEYEYWFDFQFNSEPEYEFGV